MVNQSGSGGIDRFRLTAAFLVVAVHTFPLITVNTELNFLVTGVFARIAVPFFMMVTGYFLLPRYLHRDNLSNENIDRKPLKNFLLKTGILYLTSALLYLPFSIYAGYFSGNLPAAIIKNVIFNGTFYHLWYFPAVITGVLILYGLSRFFSLSAVFWVSLILYGFGLLGDSYFGVVLEVPLLNSLYDFFFGIFSYTRNGFFYAPVFLALGAVIAKGRLDCFAAKAARYDGLKAGFNDGMSKVLNDLTGFIVTVVLMLTEGWALHKYGNQAHDSMYIMLIPCMYFLFRLILNMKGNTSKFLRFVSAWIYILHPMAIIGVRGVAGKIGLSTLFVENSMVHFAVVSLLSYLFASLMYLTYSKIKTHFNKYIQQKSIRSCS